MVVVIVVESSSSAEGLELAFDAEEVISLGRDPGSHVQLPDSSVSLRHAVIRPSPSGPVLMDQNSTNGTFLNSVRLVAGGGKLLSDGDELLIGRTRARVQLRTPSTAPQTGLSTQDIALAMVQGALLDSGTAVTPRLKVVAGPDHGLELLLSEERGYDIGRDEDVDMRLSDEDASRRHVRVVRRGSRLWVMDLGSRNGSLLDGRPLSPNVTRAWPDTAILELGATQLCIDDPVSSALRKLESAPDEPLRESVGPPDPVPAATSTQVLGVRPVASDAPVAGGSPNPAPFATVNESKGVLKLSTSSSSSAPSAPIAVLHARESEPPRRPERRRIRWTALDALVIGVAVVTVVLSALALAWFLVS